MAKRGKVEWLFQQEQNFSEKQEAEVETKISRDEEIKHDQPKEEVEEEEEVSKGMHR